MKIEYFDTKYDGNKLASWIKQLEASDSRLHKESVIEKAQVAAHIGSNEADAFLYCCNLAYDPFATFNVRKVSETSGFTNKPNPWSKFYQLCAALHNRDCTGHAARDAIAELSTQFDSDEWNTVARRVLIKDLRCGTSTATLNKILKKTKWAVPVFSCQLATDSSSKQDKMVGLKRIEQKLDGVRMLAFVTATGVQMFSRNGKVLENFPQIEEELAKLYSVLSTTLALPSFVLDGEIMGESFQALMKQAQRKSDVKTDDMVYNVFDILPVADFARTYWNAQQSKRLALLEKIRHILDQTTCVRIMDGITVDLDTAEGHKTLKKFAEDSVNAGFEGVMIKDLGSPYECKRSTFWMKWKPVMDYDLKVIAVEEGSGKHTGRMGALVCEGVDDGRAITVNVGSGYTDEQRQEYWDNQNSVIGQTAVVLADAITQNQNGSYSLRFPRFKTFRDDK
jgi:DNA ligase 1